MDEQSSLLALFTSSFLAATLLPGGSEAVLAGVLTAYPELYGSALGIATLGNTLGGMSSYVIGRLLPDEKAMLDQPADTPVERIVDEYIAIQSREFKQLAVCDELRVQHLKEHWNVIHRTQRDRSFRVSHVVLRERN